MTIQNRNRTGIGRHQGQEMYAIFVSPSCSLECEPDTLNILQRWVVGIHSDPLDRFQAFLFWTAEDRMRAMPYIKDICPNAVMAIRPVYVDNRRVLCGKI